METIGKQSMHNVISSVMDTYLKAKTWTINKVLGGRNLCFLSH